MGGLVSILSRRFTARPRRAAVRPELAHDAPPPLPLSLVLAVAGCLPADDKLRLALVSPAFRAVADETSLYQDVQLGVGSGVVRASDALLRAVSAKARGTMRTLDLSGRLGGKTPAVTLDVVVAVCEANACTLEAVDARCEDDPGGSVLPHVYVMRLLAAAVPLLRRLEADVHCSLAELGALFRAAGRNGALRVRRLLVVGFPIEDEVEEEVGIVTLVAAVEAQPSVSQLGLCLAPLYIATLLNAVVSLSLARRLCALRLHLCRLDAASMPALTRLFGREGGLVSLEMNNQFENAPLPPSPAFCAALRASSLQRLVLTHVRLFDDPDAGVALLAAATGHPSLKLLSIPFNQAAYEYDDDDDVHRAAVGATLGALVASNAPSLTTLIVRGCRLGDAGPAPLVAALAGNTALRSLDIRWNGISRPLGVALLAAVGANTGLRKIEATLGWDEGSPEVAEAVALVAARA